MHLRMASSAARNLADRLDTEYLCPAIANPIPENDLTAVVVATADQFKFLGQA
jgi:hypothetical protein